MAFSNSNERVFYSEIIDFFFGFHQITLLTTLVT